MAKVLVVDSGVAIKWVLEEPDSELAESIYADYENGAIELAAPDLLYAELGNILCKKVTFGGMSESEVEVASAKLLKVVFRIVGANDVFDAAYKIAKKHKRTFYDSLYLASSLHLNCDLVTADERLYNSTKSDFSNIILLADWI